VCLGLLKVQITLLLLAAAQALALQEQAALVQDQIAKHLEKLHMVAVVAELQTVTHFLLELADAVAADLD
jgi:O-methyltransferase involved in polyketide biosynthesis